MNEHRTPRMAPLMLQPSRRLATILILAHMASGGLLLTLPLSSWVSVAVTVILVISTVYCVHRHALLRGPGAIMALAFSDRETVRLTLRDGSSHPGRVLGSSTVGTMLTVLNVSLEGRRLPTHVVLLGDSLTAEDYRRLRVWLRWGPRTVAGEPMV